MATFQSQNANSTEALSTEEMLKKISTQLMELQGDVKDLKVTQGTVTTLETNYMGYDDRMKDVEDMVSSDNLQVRLLTNIVIKQDQEIASMKKVIRSLQQKEIKNNLIIGGIIESSDEDCKQMVADFFKNELCITQTIVITDAYRQGAKKDDKPDFTRNIVVRLRNVADKKIIFEHTSNLAGKKNVKKKLFIVKDHLLEDDRETRDYYRDLVKENNHRFSKDDPEKLKIKMKKNKILIGNSPLSFPVSPPQNGDVLKLNDSEKETVRQFKTVNGDTLSEKQSDFYSHAAKVNTTRDVTRAYIKMKMKYGDATHIMCAYRLADPEGPKDQQAVDDGEYGGARRILEVLKQKEAKNTAVFIIRYHPNHAPNLGLRRFEIIKDLARSAYKALLAKLYRKNRRQHSQDSLASVLSSADDEYLSVSQEITIPTDTEAESQDEER